MKILLLSLALLLGGCTTVVPVTQTWPEAPGLQSMQPCSELQKLPDNPKLSDVARIVAHNYSEYYTCVIKLEAWQEWYLKQQIIHGGLK
jgi:hypothetical protein